MSYIYLLKHVLHLSPSLSDIICHWSVSLGNRAAVHLTSKHTDRQAAHKQFVFANISQADTTAFQIICHIKNVTPLCSLLFCSTS